MPVPTPSPALTVRRRRRSTRNRPIVDAAICATALLVGGLLATPGAQAADNGLYLGAALTQTRINDLGPSLDFKDDRYKLIVGFLPLPFVDLYAKAGVARWQSSARTTGIALDLLDDSGTEFAYGAGIQARLGSLAAHLEYERFDVSDTDGAALISLGVSWTLL